MLWTYLHAPPSDALKEMREVLASCLPDEARPAT